MSKGEWAIQITKIVLAVAIGLYIFYSVNHIIQLLQDIKTGMGT
jgi:hypothetical protein